MGESLSQYYPPRAGRFRAVRNIFHPVSRWLDRHDLSLLHSISLRPRFALGFLLPGLCYISTGWKRIGLAVLALWLAAGAVFVIWSGHGIATFCWGLMMSLHVSSILYILGRLAPGQSVRTRLILAVGVFLVVSQGVYTPTLHWMQRHAFLPLRVQGRVVIVGHTSPASLHRGDLVACQTDAFQAGRNRINAGYTLSTVLALPGDAVEFSPDACRVNGRAIPRRRFMPSVGSVNVPQNTWMIWPELDTIVRVNVDSDVIAGQVLTRALVPREKIVGKPFQYWFWRRQAE